MYTAISAPNTRMPNTARSTLRYLNPAVSAERRVPTVSATASGASGAQIVANTIAPNAPNVKPQYTKYTTIAGSINTSVNARLVRYATSRREAIISRFLTGMLMIRS